MRRSTRIKNRAGDFCPYKSEGGWGKGGGLVRIVGTLKRSGEVRGDLQQVDTSVAN